MFGQVVNEVCGCGLTGFHASQEESDHLVNYQVIVVRLVKVRLQQHSHQIRPFCLLSASLINHLLDGLAESHNVALVATVIRLQSVGSKFSD